MKKERAPVTVGMRVRWVNGFSSYVGVVKLEIVQHEIYEIARGDGSILTTVHRRQIISRFKPKPPLREVWISEKNVKHVSDGLDGDRVHVWKSKPDEIYGRVVHFREVRKKK